MLDRIALGDERLALIVRVVLAQRMALELRVHEDAAQIRMPVEADAEHVEDLALAPVRGLPDAAASAMRPASSSGDRHLHAQPMPFATSESRW